MLARILWYAVLIAVLPVDKEPPAEEVRSECIDSCMANDDECLDPEGRCPTEAQCEKWCTEDEFGMEEI